MQWHRIWLTPSYIEYIALTTAIPFNTGHPSAVSRSRQLKAALQVFSYYKVPLTFRYSWKRLRKRRSKNLIKFPQVYIAFVLQYVHCFEKKNTYWLNESWETRLPKRLKCTIVRCGILPLRIEIGRYACNYISENERLCLFCNCNEVENEIHFLFYCDHYSDIRESFSIQIYIQMWTFCSVKWWTET